jgi:thioredoxin reductase (NADPH)
METVIIIGAGPCGLSAAAALQDKGIQPLVIEKGCLVQSVYDYPTNLKFHSTPELLEIGDIPFITPNERPTRNEGLEYYATVVRRKCIRVRTFEEVTSVSRNENRTFTVLTKDRFDNHYRYEAANVIIATGYFDWPNHLGIAGEQLPKVAHSFREAHPYVGRKVAIVGARNSGVDAALELMRVGADVTVIYRGEQLAEVVKSWVKPVFESAVSKGKIKMYWKSTVEEIKPYSIIVNADGDKLELDNDDVLVLTGFRPDRSFLTEVGVQTEEETGAPKFDEDTMETNVQGVFIAGVVAAVSRANEIFIENGRFHGVKIAEVIAKRLSN